MGNAAGSTSDNTKSWLNNFWAPILAGVLTGIATTYATYFLIEKDRQKLEIAKETTNQLLNWITLTPNIERSCSVSQINKSDDFLIKCFFVNNGKFLTTVSVSTEKSQLFRIEDGVPKYGKSPQYFEINSMSPGQDMKINVLPNGGGRWIILKLTNKKTLTSNGVFDTNYFAYLIKNKNFELVFTYSTEKTIVENYKKAIKNIGYEGEILNIHTFDDIIVDFN
jgi:hypothetical protein